MEGLQDKCAIVGVGEQEPPRIPGLDVAGVVASVGANVTNWHPGDHVMALVRGAYAAYSVAPSVLTFRPPVPAYKHSAAMFLKLRGWLGCDDTHPKSPKRPDSDREILADIVKRLPV